MNPSFPIEEVARLPLPGMAIPGDLAFSPDGRWISYLYSAEGDLVRRLYRFDPQSGAAALLAASPEASEEELSAEERLRRERQRQYELGVTCYAWSPIGERVLISRPDGLYLQSLDDGEPICLVKARGEPLQDPQFSPDGQWLAYIRAAEIFITPTSGGAERQLTQGAAERGITHGLAEYIAQEEMGRCRGYWWSPDSRQIAFIEADETHIPVFHIVHQGKAKTGAEAEEQHRYPFAGAANARVRLGVVSLESGETIWMNLGDDEDIYLARVDWLPDGFLSAQIENRRQTQLSLVRFDPRVGIGELVLEETSSTWINLNDLFKPLKDGRFLWGSERDGYRHLYLYDNSGTLIRQLTQGEWMVDSLEGVDENEELVYFKATKDSPLECHLYVLHLADGDLRRVTQAAGVHNVVVDAAGGRYIDTFDSLEQPPTLTLRSLADDSLLQTIYLPSDPRIADLGLQTPEVVSITSRDGAQLFGLIFHPPVEYGSGPFPTLVQVYGGPHAQLVTRGWRSTIYLRAQYLSSQGFLVFVLDNRGSPRRGLAFEGAIRHNLGDFELKDQIDGVNWLVAQGLTDPKRVGVYGWSYGGYMALMCLCCAPDTFQAAVAGAPVTAWDGYDTHYTERYMGLPAENPMGYQQSSALTHVAGLRGRLLLVHGLIDENVHFRHTARLINALIEARKSYELMLFPDERHGPRRLADRVYLEERLRDFFLETLGA